MLRKQSRPPRKRWNFQVAVHSTSLHWARPTLPPEDKTDARTVLERLAQLSVHGYVSPYHLSLIHLHLGERDRALELILDAYTIRDAWVVWLGVEPQFDPLRGEPSFEAILRDLTTSRDVSQDREGGEGRRRRQAKASRRPNRSNHNADI